MTRRLRLLFAGVFALVFLVGSAGIGASAWWTAPSVGLTGTANAASATVSVGGGGGTAEYKFTTAHALGPESLKFRALTFMNDGTTTLALTVALTNTGTLSPAAVDLWFWAGSAGPGVCATTIPVGTTAGKLSAPPALPAGFSSVAPGVTVTLCTATRLTATMASAAGKSVTVALALTGTLPGTLWFDTKPATPFTQTVYQVASPVVTCTPGASVLGLITTVTLRWPKIPEASSYVITRANGTTVKTVTQTGTTPDPVVATLSLSELDLLSGIVTAGSMPVTVTTKETTWGTTAVGTVVPLTYGFPVSLHCP